jgi:hypothetical protein
VRALSTRATSRFVSLSTEAPQHDAAVSSNEFDAEPVGQEHRRVEQLLARLFGDAAGEEAVLAHLGGLRAALERGLSSTVVMLEYRSLQRVEDRPDLVDLRNRFEKQRGIFPASASRMPSGATLIKPLMLKRPTVP